MRRSIHAAALATWIVFGFGCQPASDVVAANYKATTTAPPTLVLIRHGQSTDNVELRFSGWRNPQLTKQGRQQATAAGKALAAEQRAGRLCRFTHAYSSLFDRATETLDLVLGELQGNGCAGQITPQRHWRLNERHYGALEGLTRQEAVDAFRNDPAYGRDYISAADLQSKNHPRLTYDWKPPPLTVVAWYQQRANPLYGSLTDDEKNQLPWGESLREAWKRIEPLWLQTLQADLRGVRAGQTTPTCILVASHGNSLRALGGRLEGIAEDQYPTFKIKNAVPRVYEFDTVGDKLTLRPRDERNLMTDNFVESSTSAGDE